jgi:hypothetical protein
MLAHPVRHLLNTFFFKEGLKVKRLIYLLFILLIMISTIILFTACDLLIEHLLGYNCDSEMEGIEKQHGEPDRVTQYDEEGYHEVDWCYYSLRPICYRFTWGEKVGDCEVSTYTPKLW